MTYLPFDLEVALKHPERVITRNGNKISEIHYFETAKPVGYKLYAVINGEAEAFNVDGEYFEDETECIYDLFLLPYYKEKFVNVYLDDKGELVVADLLHDNLLDAKEIAKHMPLSRPYLKTIKITSLPYEPNCNQKETL